ncbi:MAG: hypothetical protein A2908_04495 [Candidatus Staskawiczbacteria bacterium RIFCSPLOWO2_01_FULL_38_12b]|uniref:Uncharacterized protein n=1 Tax=Candidatus Staskawiczbacteria bacterium RIFCSPLOWO2_01_FULL_38_12b TaxID=1802214 RepID=A0A1G2IBH7_9BACT|nr:MAG: hypothetical protein A2908_04495 [Candidatus Staskawiczbacteria bacterium RIFCSPLOWO2_01_FULL_38_12b]
MATNNQVLQEKDFLQRMNVRTMRKDLAKLREADSLQERKKISQTSDAIDYSKESFVAKENTITPPVIKKETDTNSPPATQDVVPKKLPEKPVQITPENALIEKIIENNFKENTPKKEPAPDLPQNELIEKTFEENTRKEGDVERKIKEYATEEEKQHIFLLTSQRFTLENQLQKNRQAKKPSSLSEKNALLLSQKSWQKKLDPLIDEEQKNNARQNTIQQTIDTSNDPSQKQSLEREASILEEQKQAIEKKRWVIETPLKQLEDDIKKLDEGFKQSDDGENNLKKEIENIDRSLEVVYATVSQREAALKGESARMTQVKPHQIPTQIKPSLEHQAPKPTHQTQHPKREPLASKPAFAKTSGTAMEKLSKATEIEQIQRKKFMEDVERWAAATKQPEH